MRLEIQVTPVEKKELIKGMKFRQEKFLAQHAKKCALKANDDYIRYQFNDKPAKLHRVFIEKEDLA